MFHVKLYIRIESYWGLCYDENRKGDSGGQLDPLEAAHLQGHVDVQSCKLRLSPSNLLCGLTLAGF